MGRHAQSPLDIALLVPFQPLPGSWVDAKTRDTFAPTQLTMLRARHRLTELLGVSLEDGARGPHRSLTAIALATCLSRVGLRWRVLDPGAVPLNDWRRRLQELRADPPRVVGVSSTFIIDASWLATLLALCRRILPESRLVVGGYYYATDAREFLSLDADVLCVGEGERRIGQIVSAVRDGRQLDEVPGLYLREGGRLRYTGDVAPLSLDEQPEPDWSLSKLIEPAVDLEHDAIEYSVETQRGCVFKCEFCTFRTLAAAVEGSIERAVRVIRSAASGRGEIFIVDATLTSPRGRFMRLLTNLIEAGGSPLPMTAFARVSDLDDEVCSLMARAGFQSVRIGQESGDQRMLNLMKKGTRVDQIAPAIAALGRHGLIADLGFIYGFPGETRESLAATRRLLRTINDGYERSPVVRSIQGTVFKNESLAAVRQRDVLRNVPHRFGYDHLEISASQAAEEVIVTLLELSRIPHAPISVKASAPFWGLFDADRAGGRGAEFFLWAKAVDRGIAAFAREDVEGKRADGRELRLIREQILAGIAPARRGVSLLYRMQMRAAHRAMWRILAKWAAHEREPGLLTRGALAWETGRATGEFSDAYAAMRLGSYPRLGFAGTDATESEIAAERLIELGVSTGRRRLAKAR